MQTRVQGTARRHPAPPRPSTPLGERGRQLDTHHPLLLIAVCPFHSQTLVTATFHEVWVVSVLHTEYCTCPVRYLTSSLASSQAIRA